MRILWELFITFFKIGAFTFGGGYAMIPLIQREVCENKCWVKEKDIVDILALSQSLPGAIAINTSTFLGYRIAGVRGAFAATLGVVLPSFLIILGISSFLLKYGNSEMARKFFNGINAVVVALILASVYKLWNSCINDKRGWITAITAFILLFFLHPILIIIGAGIGGLVVPKRQNQEG